MAASELAKTQGFIYMNKRSLAKREPTSWREFWCNLNRSSEELKIEYISGGDALRGNTRTHPEHDG